MIATLTMQPATIRGPRVCSKREVKNIQREAAARKADELFRAKKIVTVVNREGPLHREFITGFCQGNNALHRFRPASLDDAIIEAYRAGKPVLLVES